jgi:hypothetical protein
MRRSLSLRAGDPIRLLKAALTWDTPTLVRSKDVSAKAFLDALTMAQIRNEDELDPASSLGLGARAVVATLRGDIQLAKSLLDGPPREGYWAGLFRLFLRAWLFDDETTAFLDPLAQRLEKIRESGVRARLLMKLAGLALDTGDPSKAHSYIRAARDLSPVDSPLGFQLQLVEANLLQTMPESMESPLRTDKLVDYPWIRSRAYASARRALGDYLEEQVRSPWSVNLGFGLTAAEQAVLAQMEASWAGALWLRSDLRTLAGSLLLVSGRQAADVAYGAALWIRGGGKSVRQVIDFAEPRFDGESADTLFESLRGFGQGPGELQRLAEAVLATWDLLSESLARDLLGRLPPRAGDHPTLEMVRSAWAVLVIRVPEDWEAQYWSLAVQDRQALTSAISPDLAEFLPPQVAEDMWKHIRSQDNRNVTRWMLFGALAPRLGSPNDRRVLASAPPEAIAQLSVAYPNLVPQREIARTIRSLTAQVKGDTREGINGRIQGRVYSPRWLLGQATHSRSQLDERALDALRLCAIDARVPANYRVEALQALTFVGSRHSLPLRLIGEIVRIKEGRVASYYLGEVPNELLRVLRLGILATRSKLGEHSAELVLASRNRDDRVRQVAMEVAASALQHGRSSDVEYVITSGLFDPQERVVTAALGALRQRSQWRTQTLGTIAARLAEMYEAYGRSVRAGVVMAASTSAVLGKMSQGRALIEAGLGDRSWLVRDAARRAMSAE